MSPVYIYVLNGWQVSVKYIAKKCLRKQQLVPAHLNRFAMYGYNIYMI